MEALESRTFLTAAVPAGIPANVNISREPGAQAEESIAVDPTNPSHLFAASNENGSSLLGAVSTDGGATWTTRHFATGGDGFPEACCDPSAAFDRNGNLFFAYLNNNNLQVELLLSTDDGQSFKLLAQFNDHADQPTVTTGPGSVWVGYEQVDKGAIAYGACVRGLGKVGRFRPDKLVTGAGQNVGDLAIGPDGQLAVAYQRANPAGGNTLYVQIDSDGVGGKKISSPIAVGTTNVGDFLAIPAQARRTVDAEAGLAFDRSGGPFTGRLYMVYTDTNPANPASTNIFSMFSDNGGFSWSPPVRVNDDSNANSHFFPRIAVDQTTGAVGFAWYDCRNSPTNDQAQFFGAVGTPAPGGLNLSANFQISAGTSSAPAANNPNDYGDYSGLTFEAGVLFPAWADNSNSTGDNPDGALSAMDVYTAAVPVTVDTPPPGGPVASVSAPTWVLRGTTFTFSITYSAPAGISPTSISAGNIVVTAPDGSVQSSRLVRISRRAGTVIATYRVPTVPAGAGRAEAGTYTLSLLDQQVHDFVGTFAAGRPLLGIFTE